MDEEDRKLMRETLAAMNELKADLGEFRGEMREFKTGILERVNRIEEKQERRQAEPETCVTGRGLAGHLRNHGNAKKNRLSVFGLVVGGLSLAAVVVKAILKI